MKIGLQGLWILVVCLFCAGLLQLLCTGCQSQRYDTTVNVYGAPEAPMALACGAGLPAATAETPTARGTLRARALQAVVVNVSDNLGGTTKPIEISPGRELSPARAAQVRDNTIPLSGADAAGGAAAAAKAKAQKIADDAPGSAPLSAGGAPTVTPTTSPPGVGVSSASP